jgi:asparagine synthetase B (glutamine-hydrolysing)
MSFITIINKKSIDKFVEVLGECKKNNQGFYCFDGYLFGITQKELHEAVNSKSPEHFLCDLTGEFLYIGYNEKSKELLVANDKLGRYLIFKYEDENRVIFSNNFWRLIDFLKQNELEMSIDREAIKDFLLTGVFLNYKTFFKKVEFLPPASFIKLDLQNGEFRKCFNNYWSFHAQNEVNSIEAERELYEAINETIKEIQKRHPKEELGLGIVED